MLNYGKNKNAAAERRKTATAKKEKRGGGHMKTSIRLLIIKHPSLLITTIPRKGYRDIGF
jgi:hypothetical protein